MLANKHCEIITLSDSDGEQPPMVVTQQQEHRHPQRQNGLQKSECYGGCQSSLVPSSNSAALLNGRLLLHQPLHEHQQPQQMQRQTLAELLKADNGTSSNDGTKMCGIQQQKQRFVQTSAGGVTMGIMEEHPLDMTALVNPNRNHPLAPPSTKISTPTVKEQLIMYFQQQQKMGMQQQHGDSASTGGGSKENGDIFRPLSNGVNIGGQAASKWHKVSEWHPQFNISLLATIGFQQAGHYRI
ncbi:hypothetical protein niasHT_030953 [Heterodera trifolii]|uniref:Uncharacterized protein n=1 Tax=Heterodera trifolii TaxID=157864 RepID=A0ABD2J8H7_9BILA